MVSRNNKKERMMTDAQRVPHYGLRKLSVGVASVLLGTTLYFGFGGNTVYADTESVSSNNDPTEETKAAVDTDILNNHQVSLTSGTSVDAGSQAQSDNLTGASSSATSAVTSSNASTEKQAQSGSAHDSATTLTSTSGTSSAVTNNANFTKSQVKNGSTLSSSSASNAASATSSAKNNAASNAVVKPELNLQTASSSTTTNNLKTQLIQLQSSADSSAQVLADAEAHAGTLTDDQSHDYANYQTGTSQTVTMKDGSTLSINNNIVNKNNSSSILTFSSSSFKAGDIYTILIPVIYLKDASDVAALQPAFGTTKVDSMTDINGHQYWRITDKFKNGGTIGQNIKLSRNDSVKLSDYFDSSNPSNYWRPYDLIHGDIQVVHNDDIQKIGINYELNSADPNQNDTNFKLHYGTFKAPILNNSDIDLGINFYPYTTVWLTSDQYNDIFGRANKVLKDIKLSFNVSNFISLPDPKGTVTDSSEANIGSFDIKKSGNKIMISNIILDSNVSSALLDHGSNNLDLHVKLHVSVPDNEFNSYGNASIDIDNGNVEMQTANPKVSWLRQIGEETLEVKRKIKDYGDLISAYPSYNYEDLDDGRYSYGKGKDIIKNPNNSSILNINGISYWAGFQIGSIDNVSNITLNNVFYSLIIPDGVSIYNLDFNNINLKNCRAMTITLANGDVINLNADDLAKYSGVSLNHVYYSYNNPKNYKVDSNSSIARIDLNYSSVLGNSKIGVSLPSYDNGSYRINDKYQSGQPVQIGDMLHFTARVWSDDPNNKIDIGEKTVENLLITDPNNDSKIISTLADNYQSSKTPGVTDAGKILYEATNAPGGHPHLQHPVMYISVPQNATITDLSKIGINEGEKGKGRVLNPKSISLLTVDGIQFIKLDLSNYNDIRNGIAASVSYSNVADLQTSTKPSVFLVTADNLGNSDIQDVHHFTSDPDTKINQAISDLIQREHIDSSKTDYLSSTGNGIDENKGYWDILTSNGMTSSTMTDSNKSSGPSMVTTQDDHGANADTFYLYGSIINAANLAVQHAVEIVNLPDQQYDQKSQFAPTMTDKARLTDPNQGDADISSLATILYRESPMDLSNASSVFNPDDGTWKKANQVTDWSKIESVAVYFNQQNLPKNTTARLTLPVKDSHIYDDVNKSIYVSSAIFSRGTTGTGQGSLPTLTIQPGTSASAKLTVKGQSTVTTWVHYKDASGHDQYVELPDKTKTYTEGTDTMKRSDFMSKDSDLTAYDKSLLPSHMMIDWNDDPTIQNSNNSYLDGYHNETAGFNQKVKYYFDGDRVVYEGAIAKQVTQDNQVTRTIHYQYSNGTTASPDVVQQSKKINDMGFENPFTHVITWAQTTDTLSSVDSPKIDGYTPDKASVAKLTVNGGTKNSEVTVTYTPDPQKLDVTFIDDDADGKVLKTFNKTGVSDADTGYNTKGDIDDFVNNQHYLLVSDSSNGNDLVFDHNDSVDQHYYVHLKHTYATQPEVRHDIVNETIHYVYADGTTAHDDYVSTPINFTQIGSKDNVTGKITWKPVASESFAKVTSPIIQGYTANITKMPSITVDYGESDIELTVTYTPDMQKLDVKFIDDDAKGKILNTFNKTGVSDADVGYNTTADINDFVNNKHYLLVSDSSNGQELVFDHDDQNNQHYYVHLKHATAPDTRTSTVHETVHYVFTDGRTAAPDYTATPIEFTQNGVKDLVTGHTNWDVISSKNFGSVDSPVIEGYTADIATVPAQTINYGDDDIVETVVYAAENQKLDVTFIDDNTGNVLKFVDRTGGSDSDSRYRTTGDIDDFESQGYKLVSDSSKGAELVFDHNSKKDQHYFVHLAHGTENRSRESKVNETIHYVYSDGSKAADDYQAPTISFTENGTYDKVTERTAWATADAQTFAVVDSPIIPGFTPDKSKIDSKTVNYGDSDIEETVVYTPDAQKLDITFVDDSNNGNQLKFIGRQGGSNSDAGYKTIDDIAYFIGKGYKLVSDDTNGTELVFDNNDAVDQHYVVHLAHDTESVTRGSKVNETIHYVFSDGRTAHEDYKAPEISFTENGTHDKVTGQITWTNVDSQNFKAVKSPTINGYTANILEVAKQVVNFGDKDIEETVVYTPDAQDLDVTFIDDSNNNKVLKVVSRSGYSDQNANYNTKDDLNDFISQGYVKVSDNTDGNDLVFDHDSKTDQHYVVYLRHDTEPAQQTDWIHETIHYVFTDGTQASDTFRATPLYFVQTGTKDKVTGHITWNPVNSQNFKRVHSPKIAGYTADKDQIDAITVNYGDSDVVETVVYAADTQKLDVTFIDDADNGKVLNVVNKTGDSDADAMYNTRDDIAKYESQGYDLVSDSSEGQELIFDHDTGTDQHYVVHLTHHMAKTSRDSKINETIHYVFSNGNKAADDYKADEIDFTQTGTQDAVTGEIAWDNVASQQFAKATSPVINGYTADITEIPAITVNFGDKNVERTVVYSPTIQKLDIAFIDDADNGKVLKTVVKSGNSDSDAKYKTTGDIDTLKDQGYELVSDSSNGAELVFDHDDQNDQHYVVHLTHGTETITRTSKVNEIVHYVFSDGSKVTDDYQAPEISFTESGTRDKVTGHITWNAVDGQSFAKVTSPAVDGYKADITEIPVITVNFGDSNVDRTVVYTPTDQKLDVTFIDDITGKVLKFVDRDGSSDSDAKYSTKDDINTFENQGYDLVSDNSNGAELVFDHDDKNNQHYVVHLTHKMVKTSRESKVNETIHYVFSNGNKAADDYKADEIDFTQIGTQDAVTDEITWDNVASQQFTKETSPVINGYTADITEIPAITVNFGDKNIERTVVYTPTDQKLDVTFVDDVTGKVLKFVDKKGASDSDAKYKTTGDIDTFKDQGYELASDSSNGAELVFDHDDKNDQHYFVHLTHGTEPVNREDTVNETIHYVFKGGSKAHNDFTANPIMFTQTGTKDKVTGDVVWNNGDSKNFAAVTSPTIAGYTADITEVPMITVNFGDKNVDRTVTYTADTQKLDIAFIDDSDNGKVLKNVARQGDSDTDAKYKTKDDIQEFKNKGYELVSDTTNGNELAFDHDDSVDQHYYVHLNHGQKVISRTSQVNENVNYVFDDGRTAHESYNAPTIYFTESGLRDKVTGNITWINSDPQSFAEVVSPKIDGYTPNLAKVDSVKVRFGDNDVDRTVVYTADMQKLDITYIDDTNGHMLHYDGLTGDSDSSSGYTTKATIDDLISQGYSLVSDGTNGKKLVFDHNDKVDQHYKVHLTHATEPTSREDTVNEIIHYIFKDGRTAHDDFTAEPLTFTQTGSIDKVTGAITWNKTNSQKFSDVDSPVIDGYTPDLNVVTGPVVNYGDEDAVRTVVYSANQQKLYVTFIDDADSGKVIKTIAKTGSSDSDSQYNTGHDIAIFNGQGYELVSDSSNGAELIFDHDNQNNQHYVVHLTHGMEPASRDSKVNETIHYVFDNGNKAHDDYVAPTISFTQTGTRDKVTGRISWSPVDSSQFIKVVSPIIDGYTPDQSQIDAIDVKLGDKDIVKTVIYFADDQKLDVVFVDDTNGNVLKTVKKDGKSDADAKYNTKGDIQKFTGKGYDLVSDNTNGAELVFDHDSKTDQHYVVHLAHGMEQTSRNSVVKETVHYVYEDGSQAHSDFEAVPLTFTQTGTRDKVSGKIAWNKVNGQNFTSVKSPVIDGYTPDQSQINAIDVNFGDKNIEKTVVYIADDQKLDVTFIDDADNGKVLKTVNKSGKSDADANYNTKGDIQSFENKGYKLVSDSSNGAELVFDHDTTNDQHYVVHLTHDTEPVSRKDMINETIHYTFLDGSKAHDDYVASPLIFTQTGSRDKVTGTIVWNKVDSQRFASVKSPEIPGYTPDIQTVNAITVNFGDKDAEKTVVYHANKQYAGIKFIDDTTGKTIDSQTADGKLGDEIKFAKDINTEISQLEGQGYQLVSNNFNDQPTYQANNTKNQFEVHLVHAIKNVSQPDTVTQTIKYQFDNGTQAEPDAVQTLKFIETGVQDKVTGKITWTPTKSQEFITVVSPKIDGYTANVNEVSGQTAKFGDPDQTVKVTYTANDQTAVIKYIDDTEGKLLHTDTTHGKFGQLIDAKTSINNEISSLEGQGYKLVSNGYQGQRYQIDNAKNVIEIHVVHQIDNEQDSKTITRTIHYQYGDGSTAKPDVVQSAKFTRNGQHDRVTGQTTWDAWTNGQDFAAVTSPLIDGYTANILKVDGIAVTPESDDSEVTVVYTKNQTQDRQDHGGQPGETPTNPNTGTSETDVPGTPDVSEQPQTGDTDVPGTSSVIGQPQTGNTDVPGTSGMVEQPQISKTDNPGTPTSNVSGQSQTGMITESNETDQLANGQVNQAVKTNNGQAKAQLPQTGNEHEKTGLVGLVTAELAGMFALIGKRRKKHEE